MSIETLEHDIAGGIAEAFGLSDDKRQWIYEFVRENIKRAKTAEQPVDSALLPETCNGCFNSTIIEDIWNEWYGELRGHATAEQMAAILEKARHKVVNRPCYCPPKRESVAIEALRWVRDVNAMDYEYRTVARDALSKIEGGE